MEDSVRNMIIASIVLVLAAMYGGDTLGSWFQWKKEIDWKDGDTEEYTSEFYLEEIKAEYEFDAGGQTGYEDSDDNLKIDYDDNDEDRDDDDSPYINEVNIFAFDKLKYSQNSDTIEFEKYQDISGIGITSMAHFEISGNDYLIIGNGI